MTIVTVFRSRLREGVDAEYADVAARMDGLVGTMEGFVDHKFFVAEDGERVTIVRFRDAECQRAWAQHPEHVAAQTRGRNELYDWYDVSVSEVTSTRTFDATRS